MKYYTVFAQAYSEGRYGACDYSASNPSSTCLAGGTDSSPGGGLADTGMAIIVIVTVACLLIFTALVIRLWRRSSKKPTEKTPKLR